MVTHMKTTMDLPDELMREVKARAAADGVAMRELMIEGLRHELERRANASPRGDFVFRTFDGTPPQGGSGLQPGVTVENMIELSYGDRW